MNPSKLFAMDTASNISKLMMNKHKLFFLYSRCNVWFSDYHKE